MDSCFYCLFAELPAIFSTGILLEVPVPSVHLLDSYVSAQTTGSPVQHLCLCAGGHRLPVPKNKFNLPKFIMQRK